MTDAVAEPGGEVVLAGLTDDIVRLDVSKTLTIAEFHPENVVVWRVRMDSCGTPHVRFATSTWESFRREGRVDEQGLIARIRPADETLLAVARTGPAESGVHGAAEADRAYDLARVTFQPKRAFRSVARVDDLLAEATARVPLPSSTWYELALLHRSPSGRLDLTTQQLFLPEATRGEGVTFTVRCEPGDGGSTAFAVVARDAAFEYQMISLKSGTVPAGTYTVTATLRRPGEVAFAGLPARLGDDQRNWLDLVAEIPDRLDVIPPAHLIVALETCGSPAELQARVDRARQLVGDVMAAPDAAVRFSLYGYGAHLHERRAREEQVRPLIWAAGDQQAVEEGLTALLERGPTQVAYTGAARVECLLADLAARLRGASAASAGRPVLVAVGGRPAFPDRRDPASRILPCPLRYDWRRLLHELHESQDGMAFGAIRDGDADFDDRFPGYAGLSTDEASMVWRHLGTDAYARSGTFDARSFAVGLGLHDPAVRHLPLPLFVPEGNY